MKTLQEKGISVGLQKVFDSVARGAVHWCLRRKGWLERAMTMVEETSLYGDLNHSGVEVELCQDSTLSLFPFIVVMDVTEMERREALFPNDLVTNDESEKALPENVLQWEKNLTYKRSLKANAQNSEVQLCSKEAKNSIEIRDVNEEEMKEVIKFLRSMVR